MWPNMGSMGLGMALWWLAGVVLLIAVAVVVARALEGGSAPVPEGPEQILKRRYANGEIDREEYQRRLGDLQR
jgi:putative membrane protein